MKKSGKVLQTILFIVYFLLTDGPLTFADNGNIGQVQSFIKNIITALAGIAGLIATGFFVVGGFRYITSSGNPQSLEKAKRTIMYSAGGLAITIGAYVLSNIIGGIATSAFGG